MPWVILVTSMYYPELEKDCDDAITEFIDTTREEGIPVDRIPDFPPDTVLIETDKWRKTLCIYLE